MSIHPSYFRCYLTNLIYTACSSSQIYFNDLIKVEMKINGGCREERHTNPREPTHNFVSQFLLVFVTQIRYIEQVQVRQQKTPQCLLSSYRKETTGTEVTRRHEKDLVKDWSANKISSTLIDELNR